MVNIDMSLWNNPRRMRERIRNLGTSVMSLSAVNGFYMVIQKNWLLLGINCLFFLTMLPLFISYSKFQKEVPPMEVKDD